MISKELIKKSGIYFIGTLSSRLMSALLIPIYAFYINTTDFGTYDFAQTLVGILSPVVIMAIWEAILKFLIAETDEMNKNKVISTSVIFSLAMAGTFFFGLVLVANFIDEKMLYTVLIALMISLHTLVFVWQYLARGTGKNKLYVTAGITSTIINFSSVILFVVILKMELLGLLLSYNISQFAILFMIERNLKILPNLKLKYFDKHLLKKMILFSSPLVLNLISAWFISGFGRIIITTNLGAEANGLYSFASKFSLIVTMIGSVVTMAIVEEAIVSAKTNGLSDNFNKTLENLSNIFQVVAILAIPAIVVFYHLIAETGYVDSLTYAPWLLLYAVINTMASNMGTAFQAIDKTQYQFTTTLFGGATTFIISILLVNYIGISAIVLGQIFGAIVMLFSRYYLINKFIDFKINWNPVILKLLLFSALALILPQLNYGISLAVFAISILILVIKNKTIILKLMEKLKR
ncbi:MAG: lipopolysaccharide biosynthesis protein [Culicoidibacterales bacterium]